MTDEGRVVKDVDTTSSESGWESVDTEGLQFFLEAWKSSNCKEADEVMRLQNSIKNRTKTIKKVQSILEGRCKNS